MVFLDKTGALTEGKPQLVNMALATGVSSNQLVEDAAIAERGSEHPLAEAIRSLRGDAHGPVLEAQAGTSRAVPGRGVEWDHGNGTAILVGSSHYPWPQGSGSPASRPVTRAFTSRGTGNGADA
jgi:P-type Cu+ transporter